MGVSRTSLALAVVVASVPAHANPIEVFGLTSRRAGQANTGVAAADDATALYYDPAGLVASSGGELVVGTLGAYSHLGINDRHASLADPFGFQLAVRAPLPLGGPLADALAVGLGLHLLPKHVARVVAPAPDEPFYPYYGDRLSRIVVLPGAAVRLGHGISIGAAVNVLAGMTSSIRAGDDGGSALSARVDERFTTIARAIAGVQWQLSSSLRLGAVYRQRFEIPIAATALTTVGSQPMQLDVRASGQFTPHQIAAGIAWSAESLVASLDIGWAKWSDYAGPFAHVESRLPDVGQVASQMPAVPFENTLGVRAGIESSAEAGLVYRGGYGFETSPVPRDQRGVTNLLDGTKHTVAFGGGYVWKRLRLDAHVQVQLVATRRSEKQVYDGTGTYDPYTSVLDEDPTTAGTQTSNPGYPSIKSGGEVFSAGLTLVVPL